MITHLIALLVGLVIGILVARKNVDRTESVVARTKKLLDALKGK